MRCCLFPSQSNKKLLPHHHKYDPSPRPRPNRSTPLSACGKLDAASSRRTVDRPNSSTMNQLTSLLFSITLFLSPSACLPSHASYHRLHKQHHQHQHQGGNLAKAISLPRAQKPLVEPNDSYRNILVTAANDSRVLVTVSFHSTPLWPKSGDEHDLLILPLGRFLTPGE